MTVRFRLLGRPCVAPDGEQSGPQPRGRKSWAVLARVALSDSPQRRGDLAQELFGEADDPMAALRWSLADLRRAAGLPAILRGDPLSLANSDIEVDVWMLGDGARSAAELEGILLDGIEVRDAPHFDTWLMLVRAAVARRCRQQLRDRALRCMAAGETGVAIDFAQSAVRLDPLDESAQELFLRCLVADAQTALAAAHLAACEGLFAREGLAVSPALRAAARDRRLDPPLGMRAGVVAESLLRAGRAALDAGAADGGIETLRRAAEDAARASDPALQAEVLRALGSALVHAVRGFDGEGAVVLHRALVAARTSGRPEVAADVLRELAFVDVQAGRHACAEKALAEAALESAGLAEPGLAAGLLAVRGMNEADQGRHHAASSLLTMSVETVGSGARQRIWSLGVLARSLLLSGRAADGLRAAEASIAGAQQQRWNAFLPWPQAIRAEILAMQGRFPEATADAEQAFALGCELGDPCWEGMAAMVLSKTESHRGKQDSAWQWMLDARRRCDRVPDRYVWVSAYLALAQVELAVKADPAAVGRLADRLHGDAVRFDLPEFQAWALVHQAESGNRAGLAEARTLAARVDNPCLHSRLDLLSTQHGLSGQYPIR